VERTWQIQSRQAAAMAVQVGVAQGNLPLLQRAEGAQIHRKLTEKLLAQGAHLVVWPEGAVQEVFDEDTVAEEVKQVTHGLGVPVLFGGGVRRIRGGVGREYNTALLADADGSLAGSYDKQLLLPFGEYLPFGETFPSLYTYSPNSGRLSPGYSMDPLILAGHRITALVCYEDILPGFVNRTVAHADPELLVNMTIDTWFGHTIEPWEHLGLAQLRAVEHRRYLVRATNSGVSAIIDATGRITKKSGVLFGEDAFVGEVRLMHASTVYEKLGDWPFWAGAALIAAMALFRRR
jgi:apolipoprotein N-acyltransferase